MSDAPGILQAYLDRVAATVMHGDWDAYRGSVCLPFHLVTHAASLRIETEADLRTGFDAFAEMLRSQRITDYIRLVEGAERLDPDLISGRYVTHLMAGAHRILPPYRSQITLRREGAVWRAASISNALANSRWPLHLPRVDDPGPPKGPRT